MNYYTGRRRRKSSKKSSEVSSETKSTNQRGKKRTSSNTQSQDTKRTRISSDSNEEHHSEDISHEARPRSGSQGSEENPPSRIIDNVPGWKSDRDFLHQQVQLLMTPFEVSDCFEIASRGKRRQKDHIPADVISKSLKKWNYKVEDDLLKTLNRQDQRQITQQIQDIRLHSDKGLENTQQSDNDSSLAGKREDLEALKEMVKIYEQEKHELEELKERSVRIETMVEQIDADFLTEEIKHTNQLLKKIHKKVKKQGFTYFDATPMIHTTTIGLLSHQDIINKLFPDN